jgi:hypothetical protein
MRECNVSKPFVLIFLLSIMPLVLFGCFEPLKNNYTVNEPIILASEDLTYEQIETANNCYGELPLSIYRPNSNSIEAQNNTMEVTISGGDLTVGALIPDDLQTQLDSKIDLALGIPTPGNNSSGSPSPLFEVAPGMATQYKVNWSVKRVQGIVDITYPDSKAQVTFSKVIDVESSVSYLEPLFGCTQAPNPTQTLQAAFEEIDSQFSKSLKGNIAFNKPQQMRRGETASVELILSPSVSESALATQVVQRGGFVTSTAEPNVLIAPNGEKVTVATSQIEITPRMKAVLKSQDSEAFTVTEMHDNAEQVVSSVETTAWRWSVTAKKEGRQTLELVIYQLVKYDGKDYWPEVETYKANILVEVTAVDWLKSLDWKWFAGFIIALVGSVLGVMKWLDERKKKAAENKPSAPVRRIK